MSDWREIRRQRSPRYEYFSDGTPIPDPPAGDLREALEEELAGWDEANRDFYYENRYSHAYGIDYVSGFTDGWEHAEKLIRKVLDR